MPQIHSWIVLYVEGRIQRSYAEVYDIAKTENGEKILEFIFSIIENAGVVVPGYFLV